MTKKISLLLAVMLVITIFVPPVYSNAANPSEGYRKLLDVQIFKDSSVGGWTGSGAEEIETVNSTLPLDTTVTYNNLPSLRLNISKPVTSGWWVSLLTIRGWNSHDISQYIENGYLEFNIKGKDGGEDFVMGFRDKVYERTTGLELDAKISVSKYAQITTDWQHVKIPLKDIKAANKNFDPSSVTCLIIEKVHANPFTVWFNDLKITSPDNEKAAPAIKINQLGFIPESEKYALVTGFPEELKAVEGTEFQVKKVSDNSVAYQNKLALVTDFESVDSGEKILKADFTELKVPGEYYMTVSAPGIEASPKFRIGQDIYKNLIADSARYFYFQRQGIELKEPYSMGYPRQDKTPQDSIANFASGKKAPINITKGWHDAGDYGKYVNAGASGLSDLFWAYEMFPSQFNDNQFNIPESGNNIPDLLDECRWELEWMLKMQDSASGGFYPRVQSDSDENVKQRIIMDQNGCTTDDTACAAAILAQAYLLYKDFDPTFAAGCLSSAKKAWTFLEINTSNIVSPPGPYNVSNDSSDRLWAAASLFRATSDQKYNTYFKNNYTKFESKFTDSYGYGHTWGDMWFTAFLCYLKAESKDSQVVAWINTQFERWMNKISTRYNNNPWKNAVVPGNYFWGINMQVMNTPMDAIIGAKLLGKSSDSVNILGFGSLNWLLGTNPLRYSFVSGYGEDSAKGVYSNIYNTDNKAGIPSGYMPGGPNAYEGAGLSRFAAKCYTKSTNDWVANEHTVYWNSALVFMAAFANNGMSAEQAISVSGYVKSSVGSKSSDINEGFKVELKSSVSTFTATTDKNGFFKLENVPVIRGLYSLSISKPGYLTRNIKDLLGSKNHIIGIVSSPVEIWAGDLPASGNAQDGAINMMDVVEIAKAFNSVKGDALYNSTCDFDMDNSINISDVIQLAKNFSATSESYPEVKV
ncbi:MAG TPA: glycoside hydrolase family 9 protein [Pseudobacteroides sp.]|uniref:glycoside hydrolase family 9 protein n=1 Tax=Pseudobacteroides sp. TaxID=1968840 RepID=UPI002F92692F